MKLGLDVYSVRSQGWTAADVLVYAARLGLDTVHFSVSSFFVRDDPGYYCSLKEQADALALTLEVGIDSICPTSTRFDPRQGSAVEQARHGLQIASALGSPVLRCYLGSNADRHTQTPLAQHIEATVSTCRAVGDEALDLGVTLAIENHAGDLQGRELRDLIETAGPEHVGACIDTGNPLWVAEDPMVTLEHLAPYAVASHIRDSAVWSHVSGAAVQWVAMGDGNIGIADWVARFAALCPGKTATLEIITGVPPRVVPYLEPGYWASYPDARASELARFEALARKGYPFLGPMLTVSGGDIPEEYASALRVQQRQDVERSVRYCREDLGLGESCPR